MRARCVQQTVPALLFVNMATVRLRWLSGRPFERTVRLAAAAAARHDESRSERTRSAMLGTAIRSSMGAAAAVAGRMRWRRHSGRNRSWRCETAVWKTRLAAQSGAGPTVPLRATPRVERNRAGLRVCAALAPLFDWQCTLDAARHPRPHPSTSPQPDQWAALRWLFSSSAPCHVASPPPAAPLAHAQQVRGERGRTI